MEGLELRAARIVAHPHGVGSEGSFRGGSRKSSGLDVPSGVTNEVYVKVERRGDRISFGDWESLIVPRRGLEGRRKERGSVGRRK
jgi:hypothetical protein